MSADDTAPSGEGAREVRYVAGFLLQKRSISGSRAVFVRKNRPDWQAGRLNGVGGHVEPGETPDEAMRREFWEETGLDVDTWDHFATVCGPWGEVAFFRAWGDVDAVRTMTDEAIEVHRVAPSPPIDVIPNLTWLIPLALYGHDYYEPLIAREAAR